MRNTNLSPPWRKLLLTVHVVASVSLIGTALVLVALGISSVLGADPRTIYPAAYLVEAWLVAPLALVALGTGVLQAVLSPWGLVRFWWVTIKLTTTAGFTGVALFVLLPRLGASADAATGPAGQTFTIAERLQLAVGPIGGGRTARLQRGPRGVQAGMAPESLAKASSRKGPNLMLFIELFAPKGTNGVP